MELREVRWAAPHEAERHRPGGFEDTGPFQRFTHHPPCGKDQLLAFAVTAIERLLIDVEPAAIPTIHDPPRGHVENHVGGVLCGGVVQHVQQLHVVGVHGEEPMPVLVREVEGSAETPQYSPPVTDGQGGMTACTYAVRSSSATS